jgi:hypothetical protein
MNLRIVPLSVLLVSTVFAKPPASIDVPPSNGWQTFTDQGGFYQINYPGNWQVLSKGNAVVITSPGGPEERGVFGITPRPEGITVQESVDKEFSDPEKPSDLQKAPARLGNLPAVKVWGSSKKDPSIRIVEYYIQKGHQQYYILFQAPHVMMPKYSPVFNAMIKSMEFLK